MSCRTPWREPPSSIDSVPRGLGDAGRLTRSNQGTLHQQLFRTLADMISSGVVKPGERLPTEAELVDAYGVSRTTARRALDELRRQGIVERQPGKGTFVLHPRLHATIPHLRSITEEIEQLGYRAGTIPLSVQRGVADETLAGHLRLAVGDPVLVVTRIRTADGRPVYLATSTLNVALLPALAEADFSLGMYTQFERVTGRQVQRATQWLSAVRASTEVARHLRLPPAAPALRLERVVYLDGDLPVEVVNGYFHGQLYKHYSQLYRSPTDRLED
jgi:GntR family transcriptional regulator